MSGPPQEQDEDRAYRIQRDAEENRESALPPGEEIRLVSFTCIEAYTPSTVNNLIDGVTDLGWVRDDRFSPPFTNLVEWVRATRANPYGGAWANLGCVTDTEAPRPIGGGLQAALPPGIEEIWAEMHSVTPSLTCLVLQFVVDDSTSRALNHIFKPELATRTDHTSVGWAYVGPTQQRTELVVAERRRVRSLCHNWISAGLPGAFAAGVASAGLPTVETFVCDEAKPFASQEYPGHTDYRMVLNIDLDTDAYEATSLPGWRLAAWETRIADDPFTLRLGARWADVTAELGPYGGPNNSGLANSLTHPLFAFSVRFAIYCLLSGYEEHLADIRDRVTKAGHHMGVVREEDVEQLYGLATDTSRDRSREVARSGLHDFSARFGH